MLVDGEAQADALADRDAVLDAFHRLFIGAGGAAELIVHILEAIERNADIANTDVLDALRDALRNQRAVRRKRRTHASLCRIVRELEEVRANQRLAAREQQHGHMERREIVDEFLRLVRCELVLVFFRIGLHIAVHALEVARLRRVPDDDGADALGRAIPHGMRRFRIAQAVAEIVPREQQFRHTDHRYENSPTNLFL